MLTELEELRAAALARVEAAADEAALAQVRVDFLGRKSPLTEIGGRMREVPADQKRLVGAALNDVRTAVTEAIEARQAGLLAAKDAAALAGVDVTLPGRPSWPGGLHPLTQLQDRAVGILRGLGFVLSQGPEVETEWHCFDALNTPADHPARNEQDTFYFENGWLLRTHTSSVQIRAMEAAAPPLRVIAPGSAFRR
jgi:phenylalanyl-tRNA synthetase alpha chain